VVWGVNRYVSQQSDRELIRLLEEMRRMEASHLQDNHLLRFIDTRPKAETPLQKPVASVPEIVDVPTVEVPPTPMVDEVLSTPMVEDTLVAMSDTLAKVVEPEEEILSPPLTATEVVQDMPEFPGGIAALMRWLDKNIIYPPLVVQQNIKGVTYLTFLVNHEGVVTEPQVEAPLHPMISAAIMTAARKMPKWEPAKSSGIPAVRITIPIEYHSNK
jgi:protein TonB